MVEVCIGKAFLLWLVLALVVYVEWNDFSKSSFNERCRGNDLISLEATHIRELLVH